MCGSQGKINSYFPNYFKKIQPWIYKSKMLNEKQKTTNFIYKWFNKLIYIPKKTTALVIPPESRINKNDIREKF